MKLHTLIIIHLIFYSTLAWSDQLEESSVTGIISNLKVQEVKYTCKSEGAKVTETLSMVEIKTNSGKKFTVSFPESFLDSPKAKVGANVTIDWTKDNDCTGRPPWGTKIRFISVIKK